MSAHNFPQEAYGADLQLIDPGDAGTIQITKNFGTASIVTAAAETRTLPRATKDGIITTVELKTDGGDCTLTVTGAADGCGTFTLNDAGDYITFMSIDIGGTIYWTVIASRGVARISATADTKMNDLRGKSTATSGDNRLLYSRYELAGAGGGGECLRSATLLSAANGTAHGGHVSLEVSAAGYVTGLGAGVRGQLYAQGIAPANGTYYGMMAEVYYDASATLAAATESAILAIQANGDATAAATMLNAISFKGGASSSGGQMVSPGTSMGTVTGTIRVLINGAVAYIPYYSHEGHA